MQYAKYGIVRVDGCKNNPGTAYSRKNLIFLSFFNDSRISRKKNKGSDFVQNFSTYTRVYTVLTIIHESS